MNLPGILFKCRFLNLGGLGRGLGFCYFKNASWNHTFSTKGLVPAPLLHLFTDQHDKARDTEFLKATQVLSGKGVRRVRSSGPPVQYFFFFYTEPEFSSLVLLMKGYKNLYNLCRISLNTQMLNCLLNQIVSYNRLQQGKSTI